jgi:AbiU2
MKRVVDHFLYLVQLHENNVCIVYSPGLSSQIPESFAANAFNIFQRGCHEVEIVRLCALWDKFDWDGENILTVVDHIDSPCVLDMLSEEMRQFWQDGEEQANRCRDELRKAIKSAKEFKDSPKLAAVMNLRHKHLAHSFAQTRREKKGTVFQPIEPGDETELLEDSIPIVEALFTWVNGVSLSIAECREFRRKNAHALWTGCTFTNLR